jgi:hypothetical protein
MPEAIERVLSSNERNAGKPELLISWAESGSKPEIEKIKLVNANL